MHDAFPRLAQRCSAHDTGAAPAGTDPSLQHPSQPRVLQVGPWQGPEFAAAVQQIPAAAAWTTTPHVDQAVAQLARSDVPPELILLAQPQPGYYQQPDTDRLQQQAPLARIVLVAGTWCEGEFRTGGLPTGVLRLYWYELASWWAVALAQRAAGHCPPWSLPLDSLQAGRWTPGSRQPHNAARDRAAASKPQPLAIAVADYATFTALAAALADFGWSACWVRPGQDSKNLPEFAAGLWNGTQLSAAELAELTNFCQHQGQARVTALLDFPRVEHIRQAHAAGAHTVLAKPFVVAEVARSLQCVSDCYAGASF